MIKYIGSIAAIAALALAAVSTASASTHGKPGTEASKVVTHKPCKAKQGKRCNFVKQVKKPRAGKNGANGSNGSNGRDGSNGANGSNGLRGPQGLAGLAGKDGRDGKDGVSGYEVRTWDYSGVGPGGVATVACSSESKVAVGGGFYIRNGANPDMSSNMAALSNGAGIVASFPGRMDWSTNTPKPNRTDGWIVRFNDKPAGDVTLYAVCVNAS